MSAWRSKTLVCFLSCVGVAGCSSSGETSDSDETDETDNTDVTDDPDDPNPDIDAGPSNLDCDEGFGEWDGKDNVPPSQSPPCDIAPADAPLFVSIGFDDNGDADGMTWALDMLKERSVHGSFFMTTTYSSNPAVVTTWKRAHSEGHEIGNHTVSHLPNHGGKMFSLEQWNMEIQPASAYLTGAAGIMTSDELIGFRTPYLEYDDALLTAVQENGFHYDCSIEEGYEDGHDGSNLYWPYTLDNRSPGHTTQVEWMDTENPVVEISAHPGLWELPVYAVFTPPDDKCEAYGLEPGFRARLQARQSWFDPASGSITGFDYNLWGSTNVGGFQMTAEEFLATMKYSYDQRDTGNHAPFLFGAHTAYYVAAWDVNAAGTPAFADRRKAVEDFLDYVIEKGGKVVSHKQVLDWMRNPQPE